MFKKILFLLVLTLVSAETIFSQQPVCISLGAACGSAMHLRSLGLRTAAYPFDWIISPFESLYEALNDDFSHFLTELTLREDGNGVIDYYGFHFTHDWPTKNNPNIDPLNTEFIGVESLYPEWEKALPLVREKYRRRIQRFREACLGNERVYFFRTEYVNQEQAIMIRDLIRYKYPTLDFVLVVSTIGEKFKKPWNIDGIKNFYIGGDFNDWKPFLSQIFSE